MKRAAPASGDEAGRYLEQLLALSRDCLVFTDEFGVVVLASESAAKELGLARARLVGKPLASLVALPDRRELRRAFAGAWAGNLELTLQPRTGPPFRAAVNLNRAVGGWAVSFGRRSEPAEGAEAVFAQERMQYLVERMSDGVLGVDRAGTVEFANGPATILVGVGSGGRLPETWHGFSLRAFVDSLLELDAVHAEAVVKVAEHRSVQLTGIPVPRRDGAVLFLVDATEREQRDRAQREFLANAAHELQTPLTAIAAAVDVLQGGAKEDAEARDHFLRHLARESERMIALVQSLLVLARARDAGGATQDRVLLRDLLEGVAARLAPHDGVSVEVLAPTRLDVVTNKLLLERIVTNLADNAVKYTLSGRVLLSARARSRGGVMVEVNDTGPGMPDEVRRRVFERFYRGGQRGPDGFGLGLSVAQQAAEALGGRLELESVSGVGTRARVVVGEESR
jgi:two-component system phosphate regulon sensor histidine kinase PhoR